MTPPKEKETITNGFCLHPIPDSDISWAISYEIYGIDKSGI